ncbi:MAG: N-acetylmuramoyl-L-alanine amidase [Acidobacteriota bacterium]
MSRPARFEIRTAWRLPRAEGHAVSEGWPDGGDSPGRPRAVTWHWTATRTLERCRQLIGGPEAVLRGRASAHLAIGRSFAEGVDSYVSLNDRSWHAGRQQTLRWDGLPMAGEEEKGSRTSIGVETVNLGYARPAEEGCRDPAAAREEASEVAAEPDFLEAWTSSADRRLRVQPWSEEQIAMMIEVGRGITERWPHLGPRDHHGHHDLCPGYKVDVAGFPFARVLRGVYGPQVPDVWSPVWTPTGRRRALEALGFAGDEAPEAPEGWSRADDDALRRCQRALGLEENGLWTTAVSWAVYDAGGLPGAAAGAGGSPAPR